MIRDAMEFLIKLAVVMFMIGFILGFYLATNYIATGA